MNPILQLTSYARGLSRGPKGIFGPAAWDTLAAVDRQPDALITVDAPDRDLLYTSPDDVKSFLGVLGAMGVRHNVQVLLTEGTHGGHTWQPQQRAAAEAYAFTRKR